MRMPKLDRGLQEGPALMVVLGAVVGLPAGAVAVLLRGGVQQIVVALEPLRGHAWGVLLPAVGAMAGVWIVRALFREPSGHGVPAVIEAVAGRGGAMRRRSVFSRLLGSMVNVASGGSAGLEGPIVFSAAAVGSAIGGQLRLAERQRVILLACGVAGGIGAIFDAPLTGLIFASEVVLMEWSLSTVLPVAVSAIVATELGRRLLGAEGPLLHGSFEYGTVDLAACALLGVLAGLVSVAVVRAIHRTETAVRRFKGRGLAGNPFTVSALAGLGVGLIGYALPAAIGEGYGTVDGAVDGSLAGGLGMLALLLAGKLAATALTLGSGAPGGIFAPSLVLGALLGASFGHLLETVAPGAGFAEPRAFALVAMAGLVAGTMQAPLTGLFLVLETTRGWDLALPLMLVATISVLVSRSLQRHSFYTHGLALSGKLLRPLSDQRLLTDLQVGEMLDAESAQIEAGQTLEDLVLLLPTTRRNHFAVIDPESGALEGMLDVSALRPFIFDQALRRATPVETVMDAGVASIDYDADLVEAMELFESSGAWVLPVVRAGRYVGTVSKSTLFDRYRQEHAVQAAERE